MKNFILRASACLLFLGCACLLRAQTVKTLNPLTTFGLHGDGSVQPGDAAWVNTGNNQRGMACDPVATNLVFVNTASGGGGGLGNIQGTIEILEGSYGTNVAELNTNGMSSGISGGGYADSAAGVAEDGVVYVMNAPNSSSGSPVILYRWASVASTDPPSIAFSNTITPGMRYGMNMDIRGAGTNTQIIIGSSQLSGATGTNVVIFTTTDGTNFSATRLATDAATANFSDGIAFGAGNTFWAKNVNGAPLRLLTFNLVTATATTVKSFDSGALPASANLGPIAVDTNANLLAALEAQPNSTAAKFVRLYDISDTNRPPVLLDIEGYTFAPPVGPGTAPPGNLDFCGGRLYSHVMNNGLMAFSVDTVATPVPTIASQPAATNKLAVGATLSLSIVAYPAVTYQWRSNEVDVAGATNGTFTLSNVTTNHAALYTCLVTNFGGSVTVTSRLEVVNPADLFHLSLLWRAGPLDGKPYFQVATGNANTPNQRQMAYNPLSNHLYIVARGAVSGPASSNYAVFVVNATNGDSLYTLNTNGLPNFVISDVPGANGIALMGIGVAEDGAIYACNEAPDSYGGVTVDTNKMLKVFRWADGGSNTVPALIWQGEPTQDTVSNRWGDNLTVRGQGTTTQILLDKATADTGNTILKKAAILVPTDASLTAFNAWWFFTTNSPNNSGLGRSLEFDGTNNFIWQRKKAGALVKTQFDPSNVIGGSPPLTQIYSTAPTPAAAYPSFPTNNALYGVGLDLPRNLAAGVFSNTPASVPDSLNLYEISNPNAPVLLGQYSFPQNPRSNNVNAVSHTFFASNGTDVLVFSLDANNGIMVFKLATGPLNPPLFIQQPQNLRFVLGVGSGSFTVNTLEAATFQWQKQPPGGGSFTNIPGATSNSFTITNPQLADAANYRAVATNVFSGATTSSVATVTVILPEDEYSLQPLWAAAPGGAAYVSSTGAASGTPNQRTLAYGALSNHVYVVSRGGNSSSNFVVFALDADTGAVVATLNTNGIYNGGAVAEGGIGLVGIGVAEDGAIYICNEAPDACGCSASGSVDSLFRLYRWADAGSNTLPVQVFEGDPAGQTTALRWGDVLYVRGAGTNTEIILDTQQGNWGAVLKPTDASMTAFTNEYFSLTVQGTTIGRSTQFGDTNSVWQRRGGATASALRRTSYDLTNHSSAQLASHGGFARTMGPVALDAARGLLAGVDFNGATGTRPDTVDLYDVADLDKPLLAGQYNFPVNQQGNANFIGAVVFAGNRVYALNGNNGIVAFTIQGPKLTVARSGSDVVLCWTTNVTGLILEAAPSLEPPQTWTNAGSGTVVGDRRWLTNSTGAASLYYRLRR